MFAWRILHGGFSGGFFGGFSGGFFGGFSGGWRIFSEFLAFFFLRIFWRIFQQIFGGFFRGVCLESPTDFLENFPKRFKAKDLRDSHLDTLKQVPRNFPWVWIHCCSLGPQV